mgnify:CR=1 FL=1
MSKVALCLHGLFDSATDASSKGADGHIHIRKHILDQADVDVYIHSWDVDKQEQIRQLYQPKDIVVEPQRDYSDLIKANNLHKLQGCPRPVQTVLSHLYGVSAAIKLAYSSGKDYDVVVKARFDLGRINRATSKPGQQNPYPVQCINFTTNILPNTLYMADWNHFAMGPADMWFYGDWHTMSPFTSLFDCYIDNLSLDGAFSQFATQVEGNPGDISNAVVFYKYWMIQNGLWHRRKTLPTSWE